MQCPVRKTGQPAAKAPLSLLDKLQKPKTHFSETSFLERETMTGQKMREQCSGQSIVILLVLSAATFPSTSRADTTNT